jgi:hypothetical protein
MTVETLLLAVTTLIALVAVIVAVVAVRAVGRLSAQVAARSVVEVTTQPASKPPEAAVSRVSLRAPTSTSQDVPELVPRVVQGRVVVPPTQAQVVRTALGRPGVRLSVFAHGLARALRAENRDRIVALMRREYRHRRRERLRAGRQAIRMARPTSAPSTDRLHQHLLEPKPLSLTDRMISS